MTTKPTAADAAIYLLNERLREHDRGATRAMVATIYHDAAPVPDDVDPAVKIVEKTIFEAGIVEAKYHEAQVDRFRAAIEQIEGGE